MKTPVILHVIDKLSGGGAEAQLAYLVNNSNYKHVIVYYKKGGEDLISSDCKLFKLNSKSKFSFLIDLYVFIKNYQCDIVQGWLPEYYSIIASLSCLFTDKVFISCDRRAPVDVVSKLYFRDRLKLISHLLSTKVIANFERENFGLLSRLFVSKYKFKVIYNGYGISSSLINKATQSKSSNTFFFVGRLVNQKRPLLVIDIFDHICEKYPNVQFNLKIFGDGPLKQALLEKINVSANRTKIEYLGFKKDWCSLLEPNSTLLYPSLKEGMPNIIFETILHNHLFICSKIPEIYTHFPGVQDVFVDVDDKEINKFYIKYESCNRNYSDVMIKLKNFGLRFTIDEMVRNWESEYDELIREKYA